MTAIETRFIGPTKCCECFQMRTKKDCYFITEPSDTPWLCAIGDRGHWIPADIYYRVWSLRAGSEFGTVVCMEPKHPYYINAKGELARHE